MSERIRRAIRSAWISVGVTLLVLVLLESILQVVFGLRDRGRPTSDLIPEERLVAANPGQNWVKEYLRELRDALQEDWHSYVYWRLRPYHAEYVNIDERGIRRTWNTSVSPAPNQLRMFMFGGSTMWGWGARDDFTIPSLVSKKLDRQLAGHVWVVNLGEPGYVNTQEVITLMLELRRGNVPDIAVFYDGVNDSWAAFQSGVAGVPQNEANRVVEFNLRDRLNLRRGFVERLALYRLSRGIVRLTGEALSGGSARRSFLPPSLANDVVDVYLENVRLVNALAREYGFRAVFFWQPSIYTKKHLSEVEQRWYGRSREQVYRARFFAEEYRVFNEAFQQKIKASKFENVFDLSELFANDAETIFFDRFHVSEAGNEKIAGAMAQTLRSLAQEVKR